MRGGGILQFFSKRRSKHTGLRRQALIILFLFCIAKCDTKINEQHISNTRVFGLSLEAYKKGEGVEVFFFFFYKTDQNIQDLEFV